MSTFSLTSFPVPEDAKCPECNSTIRLYDPEGSEFCVCRSCSSYIQFINDQPKKLKPLVLPKQKPVIPLGTEGLLQGIPFKVTGYFERQEGKDTQYAWREYVLYNYEKGYAILSEYDGHWNLVFGKNFLPELVKPANLANAVLLDGVKYRLFHKYTPRTTSLLGEFDWDVMGERINVQEFVAPPYVIIKEKSAFKKGETGYYQGTYQEPEVIASVFNLDYNLLPVRQGILSNQPSEAYNNWIWSIWVTLYMILALFIIQLFVIYSKPEVTLMDESFAISYDAGKGNFEFKPFITPSFNVVDVSSTMGIQISSSVSNNWLEATTVLVNESTNETWEVNKGIEYYEGVEGGEQWSEGTRTADVVLSGIPRGRYHLNVYPASGDPLRDLLSIKVTANGFLWRNLIGYTLLLSVFPLICFLLMRRFEKRRWSNSNYSPFES